MAERQRILIAGCGDVGTRLGLELASAGHEVFGLRRDPSRLPARIRGVAADLSDPASLSALPERLGAVVYTAAAGASDEAAYRRTYVEGPRNLIEALVANGERPARFVFASSTSVYGQENGELVDESSPTEPSSFRGRLVREGERVVLDGPFEGCVVRFGGIYGPGRTYLIDAVREGRVGLSADGVSPHTNRIHRDDAALCIAHLLSLRQVEPIYVAVDTESARRDEVVRYLAELLDVEPAVGGGSRRRGGDKRCSSARLVASGYRFRYPSYREGYAALLGDESGPGGR